MGRLRVGATQHRQPDCVSASVYGSVYTCHAHHHRHARWDWRADNTLATTATQNVGELLTTAQLLWLYASCHYRRSRRYAGPVAPGTCDPRGSVSHETKTPYAASWSTADAWCSLDRPHSITRVTGVAMGEGMAQKLPL